VELVGNLGERWDRPGSAVVWWRRNDGRIDGKGGWDTNTRSTVPERFEFRLNTTVERAIWK